MEDFLIGMTIGMLAGMVGSPIMMRLIKILRVRRRVSLILREAVKARENESE